MPLITILYYIKKNQMLLSQMDNYIKTSENQHLHDFLQTTLADLIIAVDN